MLEWANPWAWLLVPFAVAAPWFSRRPRLAISSLAAVQLRPSLRATFAWLPELLGSVALLLFVVALARPQLVNRERSIDSEGIDILLVLDTSGSMQAEDYQIGGRAANRLEAAKEVVADFIERRPDDRIGLVVFGSEAFTQVPLTLDHAALTNFLGQVQIGMAGDKATAVGDALAITGKRLKDLEAPSRIAILLTDGRNNAGALKPLEAAEALKALGVKVYTIGMGSAGGGGGFFGMGGRSDLDEGTLTAIARTTGAEYFRAADTKALEAVYATIDKMEKSTAKVEEFVHRDERYHPWLAAGLLLLALRLLLSETWLRRLP